MARESLARLNPAVADDDDPDQVDVESGRETGAVAASITTRERRAKRAKKKAQAKWKPIYIYAAIAVGVSLIGVLAAWAISGGSKKHGTENQTQNDPGTTNPGVPPPSSGLPKQNPPPRVTPVGVPNKNSSSNEAVIYRFDPAEVAPFRVRLKGSAVEDGKRGVLPRGVTIYALKNDTEAEFEAHKIGDVSAFTITRYSVTPGAQLAFELERDASAAGIGLRLKPDTEYRVRVQYRAGGGAQLAVSIHTLAYMSLQGGYRQFLGTGDQWKTAEFSNPPAQ